MLHINPRDLARPLPLAYGSPDRARLRLLTSTTHSIASDPADGTVDGIALTDTNEDILAAPTGVSLTQNNRDVDLDGVVDISLLATFSGGVAGITGYEFELSSATTSGGSYTIVTTAVSQTGKCWFKAVTLLYYRVRVRAIAWNGVGGNWSSYTTPIKPQGQTGAPAAPSGVSAVSVSLGWVLNWTQPSELDYDFTEIALGAASAANIIAVGIGSKATLFYTGSAASALYLRHVNTSGLRSAWSSVSPPGTTYVRTDDIDSGVSFGAKTAIGTANSGSVNPGSVSGAFVHVSFKCTNADTGVTLNLNGTTRTVDFTNNRIVEWGEWFSGSGPYTFSKSGGGTYSDCSLSAIGIK